MDKRTLWITWYVLFMLCALLGFIPEPQGFWKIMSVLLGICFFIPGGLLLKWADDRADRRTVQQVLTICGLSLGATTLLLVLNYVSVLWSELWGNILYGVLVVVSSPMVCVRYWIVSLFGWACLLSAAVSMLRKHRQA